MLRDKPKMCGGTCLVVNLVVVGVGGNSLINGFGEGGTFGTILLVSTYTVGFFVRCSGIVKSKMWPILGSLLSGTVFVVADK